MSERFPRRTPTPPAVLLRRAFFCRDRRLGLDRDGRLLLLGRFPDRLRRQLEFNRVPVEVELRALLRRVRAGKAMPTWLRHVGLLVDGEDRRTWRRCPECHRQGPNFRTALRPDCSWACLCTATVIPGRDSFPPAGLNRQLRKA